MASDRFIGLMSGTSLDGVDAVLARFSSGRITVEYCQPHPLPEDLVGEIRACIQTGQVGLDQFARLDAALGEALGEAAEALIAASGCPRNSIRAIGSHGQTLWHAPRENPPATLQIGDPNRIGQITGLPVVADFRRRDMAAGGQGAPLAPAFHAAAFADPGEDRAVVNIGGMANLTLLPTDGEIRGYDTGPGNVLMDEWIRGHQGEAYDRDGDWAGGGRVLSGLLERLLADPWFHRPPPKSTGREDFHRDWLDAHLAGSEADQDVQATLLALTVEAIAREVAAGGVQRVLVCGGGARNRALMRSLTQRLDPVPVSDTDPYGVAPEWVEATAFAWLARETLARRPGNLPAVTGASRPVVLGGVWPADGKD